MQDSLGRNLGITSFCGLVLILLTVLAVLFENQSGSNSSIFFWFFLLTTSLNTAILYWPVHRHGAIHEPATRAVVAPTVVGMSIFNLVLAGAVLLPTVPLLNENTALIFSVGLILLAFLFLIAHYFLFQFFTGWLVSPAGHAVGFVGFFIGSFLFFFYWVGRWLDWDDMVDLFAYVMMKGTRDPAVVELYGVYYMMAQYFFIALFPYYLVSIFAKKRFKVSGWMHSVYWYSGLSGLVGFFMVIYYGTS